MFYACTFSSGKEKDSIHFLLGFMSYIMHLTFKKISYLDHKYAWTVMVLKGIKKQVQLGKRDSHMFYKNKLVEEILKGGRINKYKPLSTPEC